MTVLGPLALYVALSGGDELSTRAALSRPGIVELGHRGTGAKALQAACFIGADLLIQKKAPKLRWYYRGAIIVGHAIVIRHNMKAGR